jgi:hypothetical protein
VGNFKEKKDFLYESVNNMRDIFAKLSETIALHIKNLENSVKCQITNMHNKI